MITKIKHLVTCEHVDKKLRVKAEIIDEFMPTDVIGVYQSRVKTKVNIFNKIIQGMMQLTKAEEDLRKLQEDLERFKPEYDWALKEMGKEAIIPYFDQNKKTTKKTVQEEYSKLLTTKRNSKENLGRAIIEFEKFIKYVKELE